jgi:small subunit ribosomal protein S4
MKSNSLEDVLALTIENILERRLQTLVHRRGLANTIKQARQVIIHGKVKVGGKVVNVPRYPVSKDEEETIQIIKPEGK